MKTKDSQQSTTKSKGDRLGWTPRSEVRKTNVCLYAKGEIVSASVCHISAPVQIVREMLDTISPFDLSFVQEVKVFKGRDAFDYALIY